MCVSLNRTGQAGLLKTRRDREGGLNRLPAILCWITTTCWIYYKRLVCTVEPGKNLSVSFFSLHCYKPFCLPRSCLSPTLSVASFPQPPRCPLRGPKNTSPGCSNFNPANAESKALSLVVPGHIHTEWTAAILREEFALRVDESIEYREFLTNFCFSPSTR